MNSSTASIKRPDPKSLRRPRQKLKGGQSSSVIDINDDISMASRNIPTVKFNGIITIKRNNNKKANKGVRDLNTGAFSYTEPVQSTTKDQSMENSYTEKNINGQNGIQPKPQVKKKKKKSINRPKQKLGNRINWDYSEDVVDYNGINNF